MLMANSAAILTDAFPAEQRGFALGTNQVAGLAGLAVAIARGGLQFMLIIWLQGIWLPLHGYDYSQTPLWAGIFLLPLTAGFLVSGPVAGFLSDKFGSRGIATAGMAVFGGSLIGLMLLPVNFPYPAFALLIALNGIGSGMFAAPNSSSIMGSVPASQRGAASGMRSTFQNSGTALSIGVFFSVMIAGLASRLPVTRSGRPSPAGSSSPASSPARSSTAWSSVRPGRRPVRPRRHGVGPARRPSRSRPIRPRSRPTAGSHHPATGSDECDSLPDRAVLSKSHIGCRPAPGAIWRDHPPGLLTLPLGEGPQ